MRKLFAATLFAGSAVVVGPAIAADLPTYPLYPPTIDIPDVDYGMQDAFYLRGSAAWNGLWSNEAMGWDCINVCGTMQVRSIPFSAMGYGYSVGVGIGYETGTGLRLDATLDHVGNDGLKVTKGSDFPVPRQGDYTVKLRSTLALANAYFDFSLNDRYDAAGGAFGYVGAGVGAAFNHIDVSAPVGVVVPGGGNVSFATAGMFGVGYDFGSVVADLGYRGVYINHLTNNASGYDKVWADHNWLHEVRGTVRYRFN